MVELAIPIFSKKRILTVQSSNTASNDALQQYAFEPLLNDGQAALFLGGLHPKTVQRMARRGELPAYHIGKFWRYKASELTAWLVLHSSGQKNPPAHNRKELIQ
jgi:excisionase family DNA binding protein